MDREVEVRREGEDLEMLERVERVVLPAQEVSGAAPVAQEWVERAAAVMLTLHAPAKKRRSVMATSFAPARPEKPALQQAIARRFATVAPVT